MLTEGQKLIHEVMAGIGDIAITDRSLIWNSDLIETLEFDNLIVAGGGDDGFGAPTARKAAAPMPARIFPTATTRTG